MIERNFEGKLLAHAAYDICSNDIRLYLGVRGPEDMRLVTMELGEPMPRYAVTFVGEPLPSHFLMDSACARELAETLWTAGIRPPQADNSPGAIAAMQRHIDYLQLVIDRLMQKGAA